VSRRGRRTRGVSGWLELFEAIAVLHARGLGTTEIQSALGCRREVIVRVCRVLRAAEYAGHAKAAHAFASSECATAPFPKCPQDENGLRASHGVVHARVKSTDGEP